MIRALQLFCLMLVGTLGGSTADACTSPETCLRRVVEVQGRVRSLSARFVQTKRVSLLAEPIETTGTFSFTHPDTVVWRVEDPSFELRVEGGKLQQPEGGGAPPAGTLPSLSTLFVGMTALFAGDMEQARGVFELEARESGNDIVVDMKPKDAPEYRLITSIRLTFAQPDIILRQIRIEEAVGDSLEIVLLDTERSLAER